MWGKEKRFKKKVDQTPGPTKYQLEVNWKGKKENKDTKFNNWMNNISKGPVISMYYS